MGAGGEMTKCNLLNRQKEKEKRKKENRKKAPQKPN